MASCHGWLSRSRALVAVLGVALSATGCDMLHSDAENAGRHSEQARKSAARAMKQASLEAAPAQPVSGDALVKLLSGRSHVKAYFKGSSGGRPYFTTYAYFAPGGAFIARDTDSKRSPEYEGRGRWRVDGDVLCITTESEDVEAGCFKIRVAADGAVQYWIHDPGGDFHGLFTKNVIDVRPGLQVPAYVSEPAQMGR